MSRRVGTAGGPAAGRLTSRINDTAGGGPAAGRLTSRTNDTATAANEAASR